MTQTPDADDARKRTEAAVTLQRSEARLRLMIDAVPAMITYLDTDERFLFCNQPYLDMLGMRDEDVLGRSLRDILGDPLHLTLRPCREQVLAGQTARYERPHTRADGEVRDLSVTFVPHLDDHGTVVGFFCLTLDITELKTLERRLAHMAGHDTLTGLPNRALYDDRLATAIERNKRHQEPFALVYVDIDHFKDVNDTHGHAVGDRLLQAFAARMRQSIRAVDIAARLGGDEFALILEGPLTADSVAGWPRRFRNAMREPFELDSGRVAITASLGIAIADDLVVSAATLESRADAALYEAKARGRDTFVVHGMK